MSPAFRRAGLVLVAVLIAQTAWIMAVPPFRGSDEVDHAFRAAGVAMGQWRLTEGAHDGRGQLVWVPVDLATAAAPQCLSLSYLGPDNCRPVEVKDGRALMATAAGTYDPLFYWVIGMAGRPFQGAHADYAMRATTALMCALVIALGVGVMTLAGTGRWVTLGVLAALTPEILYSSVIAAPDGPEMALGFLLWASLLAAIRVRDPAQEPRLLAVGIAAAVPLTFLRSLGPMWVLLIVAGAIAFAGWREALALVTRQLGVVLTGVVAVALAAAWWAFWLLWSSHVHVPDGAIPGTSEAHHWLLAFNVPAWVLQMVGAFPFRDQPLPMWIYPLALLVIGFLVIAAWKRASTTYARRMVFWLAIASLIIPVVLSIIFMPSVGNAWQGRYELPLMLGFLPLCGLLLDDAGFAPDEGSRLITLAVALLTITQVASVVHVERMELGRGVSVGDPAWVHPSPWALGALMLLACAVVLGLASRFVRPAVAR